MAFNQHCLTDRANEILSLSSVFDINLSDADIAELKPLALMHCEPELPATTQQIKQMLAALLVLKKKDDDHQTGDFKTKIYIRMLQQYSNNKIGYAVEKCLNDLVFYPTPSEIIDRMSGYEPADQKKLNKIKFLVQKHQREEKLAIQRQNKLERCKPLQNDEIEALQPEIKELGIKMGWLKVQDGKIVDAYE